MTLKEIIIEALHDPQNRESDGSVKWNWVDSNSLLNDVTFKNPYGDYLSPPNDVKILGLEAISKLKKSG